MGSKSVPSGYTSITPYLIVKDAVTAIEFYKNAFGATEVMRLADPSGKVGHAELQIGDARIMLADEFPEYNARCPESYGGTAVSLLLYVADVDAVFAKAIAAGATAVRPVADQFYGDRSGNLLDPSQHVWTIATQIEEMSPTEMERRYHLAQQKSSGASGNGEATA